MEPRQARFLCIPEPPTRSRLTAFFRPVLAIPHFIVLCLLGIVAIVCVVIAWFAIVFTGRFPEGLYNLVTKYQRYSVATMAYACLLTERFPAFVSPPPGQTFDADMEIPPAMERYDRVKTGLRFLHAIPTAILSYGMGPLLMGGGLLAWFSIVFTGRLSPRFRESLVFAMSYSSRLSVYSNLQTEDWPSLLEKDARVVDPLRVACNPATGALPPVAPAPDHPQAPPPPPPSGPPPPPPGY
ncbi:MAG: DUF4389 domain-containing protein [Thermoleophilia bacterium]|nr:DUF4389 domain-containing protein [Thermoleophilia bacterium]